MDASEQSGGELLTQNDTSISPLPMTDETQQEVNSTVQHSRKKKDDVTMSGRFTSKVMIVVAGQRGAGKSSIIKMCFPEITSSDSLDVVEYGKNLNVTSQSSGILSFVELSNNLAAATKFRTECFDCKQIYPNMIIFTVSAGDNRMVGPDSYLRKCLKFLKDTTLIDDQNPNIIVVVTHAMSLPMKLYRDKTEEIMSNIRNAVCDILRISDVKVVFVENKPSNYEMQKEEGSEFYKLPDGQLSHFSLINALSEQLKANKDSIGKHFCEWYFRSQRCVEDHPKASVLYTSDTTSKFNFQYIGRGYCPRTENMKNVTFFPLTETNSVNFLGKHYIVPSCVAASSLDSGNVTFYQLTSVTKDEYQCHKIADYGLKIKDNPLCVNVHPSGKWIKDKAIKNRNTEVIFVYEIRLVEIALNKSDLRSYRKQELITELSSLPKTYQQETCLKFREFFSKWGTHFVSGAWLGGYIEMELRVNSRKYTKEEGDEIRKVLQSYCFVNDGQADASITVPIEYDVTVRTYGGEFSTHMNIFQDVRKECLSAWENSLTTHPIELKHCFKLQPYYKIADKENYQSLKKATQDYISGTMFSDKNSSMRGPDLEANDHTRSRKKNGSEQQTSHGICFPMLATVYTKEGRVESRSLTPGCEVWTLSTTSTPDNNRVKYTEFCTYLHYDPHVEAEFLVLNLDNHQTLTISKGHHLFALRSGSFREVAAENVNVGDEVFFVNQDKQIHIVKVSSIFIQNGTGICCPLTYDGTLIVDGVLVSCYASTESFVVAHTSLLPLRLWYSIKKALCCLASNSVGRVMPSLNYSSAASTSLARPNIGIHIYARILTFLRRRLWFNV